MLTKPNFQELLDVVKATENLHTDVFDMSEVFILGECGTAGCMIGNYNLMKNRRVHTFLSGDQKAFGITRQEYRWLFSDMANIGSWNTKHRDLSAVTREQALARLRKFIYYKLHKHEMCYDEKRGVSERSRTLEGNHGFVTLALAECGV